MDLLLIIFLPVFIAGGLLYLIMTMGDAIVSAARDWIEKND